MAGGFGGAGAVDGRLRSPASVTDARAANAVSSVTRGRKEVTPPRLRFDDGLRSKAGVEGGWGLRSKLGAEGDWGLRSASKAGEPADGARNRGGGGTMEECAATGVTLDEDEVRGGSSVVRGRANTLLEEAELGDAAPGARMLELRVSFDDVGELAAITSR